MSRMGSYCRAYHARDFAAFPGWRPDAGQLRAAAETAGEGEPDEDQILYLQEDFSVTAGIFLDENVVFAEAGAEWRAFCADVLGFAPPLEPAAESGAGAAPSIG